MVSLDQMIHIQKLVINLIFRKDCICITNNNMAKKMLNVYLTCYGDKAGKVLTDFLLVNFL